jgi:hypothetical protein
MIRLVEHFTDINADARARLWVREMILCCLSVLISVQIGAMIIELLKSSAAREAFEAGPENKR